MFTPGMPDTAVLMPWNFSGSLSCTQYDSCMSEGLIDS